jgi:hypothetical protein
MADPCKDDGRKHLPNVPSLEGGFKPANKQVQMLNVLRKRFRRVPGNPHRRDLSHLWMRMPGTSGNRAMACPDFCRRHGLSPWPANCGACNATSEFGCASHRERKKMYGSRRFCVVLSMFLK